MNKKSILRLRPADANYAKKLFGAIEAETNPNQINASNIAEEMFERSLSNFDFLSSQSFWFLVAVIDNEPVGYATVIRIPKADGRLGTLYVDEVYVLNNYRRQGVGTALLTEVHHIAQELQFWRIRLNADPSDTSVCDFYDSLGFRDNNDGFFQKDV